MSAPPSWLLKWVLQLALGPRALGLMVIGLIVTGLPFIGASALASSTEQANLIVALNNPQRPSPLLARTPKQALLRIMPPEDPSPWEYGTHSLLCQKSAGASASWFFSCYGDARDLHTRLWKLALTVRR